jgi:hypothetical protein
MVSTPMILTLSAIIMKERMQNEKFWNRSGTRWNCFSNSVRKIYWNATHAGLEFSGFGQCHFLDFT